MSFYTELQPYIEYLHSIRRIEKYLSFDMKFPSKWGIPKSLVEENQMVPFNVNIENYKGISFVSEISENEIKLCLSKILKVIKLNIEKEMKDKLFKDTVDKLKSTFDKTDLQKLQKLYFDFENDYTDEGKDIEMVSEREN